MLTGDRRLEKELEQSWRVNCVGLDGPRAALSIVPTPLRNRSNRRHLYAVAQFAALTLNPDCDLLKGPCNYSPCGRFFITKRKKASIYCSRRCCQLAGAARSTKRRRPEDEKRDKLKQIAAAIETWRNARTKDDWKISVCKQLPEVSLSFLTRAVSKSDLVPPTRSDAVTVSRAE